MQNSASPVDAMPADAIEVGRIIGAWGVKGAIKVKPFAADPQALFSTKRWYLKAGEATRVAAPRSVSSAALPELLRVVQAREQGDGVVATVQDVADRDAAQALSGARVFVPRASFPTPAEGEFYWVDLIGLQVRDRQGVALGQVVGLIETGPHCVLRIAPVESNALDAAPTEAAARERLIPFVAAYVDSVDVAAGCIVVDWDVSFED